MKTTNYKASEVLDSPVLPWAKRSEPEKWQAIRQWRNAELRESDWTQGVDVVASMSPENVDFWKERRQTLRDIPEKYEKADDVELPFLE